MVVPQTEQMIIRDEGGVGIAGGAGADSCSKLTAGEVGAGRSNPQFVQTIALSRFAVPQALQAFIGRSYLPGFGYTRLFWIKTRAKRWAGFEGWFTQLI